MMKSRDEQLDDEMYREMLEDARREARDTDDGVKCTSCMDDPTLCRQLGICDEHDDEYLVDLELIADI